MVACPQGIPEVRARTSRIVSTEQVTNQSSSCFAAVANKSKIVQCIPQSQVGTRIIPHTGLYCTHNHKLVHGSYHIPVSTAHTITSWYTDHTTYRSLLHTQSQVGTRIIPHTGLYCTHNHKLVHGSYHIPVSTAHTITSWYTDHTTYRSLLHTQSQVGTQIIPHTGLYCTHNHKLVHRSYHIPVSTAHTITSWYTDHTTYQSLLRTSPGPSWYTDHTTYRSLLRTSPGPKMY